MDTLPRPDETERPKEPFSADPNGHVVTSKILDAGDRYPRNSSVVEVFQREVARGPDRMALTDNERSLSYLQLDRLSDGLASTLVDAGIAAGDRVGICMDRSPELIVSMLAILKAGAVYVPLASGDPAARLGQLVTHAELKRVLVPADGIERPHLSPTLVLDLEDAADSPRAESFSPVRRAATDPAYLMYTSGSTGEPNGCLIPHRGIVRLVKDTNYLPFADDLVILHASSPAFDASTFEIWGALLNGAQVAILREPIPTVNGLRDAILRHRVTTCWLTAGLFNLVVDEAVEILAPLRHVLTGGDVASPEHFHRFRQACPDVVLINGYGPTENTTFSACLRVESIPAIDRPVPIGKPISHSTAHVLDAGLEPLPPGTPGELYLGGDGVALGYWKRQLDGIPTLLELPSDRPRPAEQSYRGGREKWVLPGEVHESLVALGRREGVTLFMTLLAGLQILLHRYSGQEDIVVGSPIAGRSREELEKLIGFFVNTLVLRTDLSGGPTVSELLGRVREVALGAYGHQDLPFEKLVEELNPPRSRSHSPLFQVMLVLQNAPQSTVKMPELEVVEEDVHNGTSKFDLTLSVAETEEGLKGSLEYSTDLFDAATIRRMLAHLQRLLEAMVADPAQRIGRLPMLSVGERRQLLLEWNDTKRDYPRDKCVHQRFEEQVKRTPEAVAAVFGDEELSYAELNTRANQLAHHLIELGVGPETLVALCLERSLELLVGVLGILKAGGAYVPLDPSHPAERLEVMLEDAAASVLLTQQGLAERLPQPDARVVWLDDDWPEIAAREQENPPCSAGPDDLAYVIYTSGSTGEPKGVAMPHRPLTALVTWQQHALPLAPGAAVAQFAPLSFDVSFQEMFTTWASGGRLVLMTDDARRDPFQLLGFLGRHGIQRLFLPFVALRQLAEAAAAQSEPLDALTEVITAGEQLHVTGEIAAFFARLPHCTLHNHYGPSETHVVTAFTLQGTPDQWSPLPSIGRPISNTRIYLLDGESQPVSVGVTGELHIGGHSLARGYFRRPELTAEKFVVDPFGEAGARLYRTGDLARYRPDGNLEFVARIDNQVKIRGFRIEPGEIEAVLGGHPGVAQSVVVAREDQPGDKRLVAYVVPVKAASVQVEELREALKKRVPEYMVPSALVLLDMLPLTPNGKLDRAALPAPEIQRPAALCVAPRTPTEELLTGIYEELLGVKKVGIHDDFFDLGGHSLIAARVISRVRATLGAELPIRSLFEAPTVAGLAATLAQGGAPAAAEPLERVERSGALELSHAQRRLWFLDQYETNRTVYNIPLAVRLRGRLDAERLGEALERIVRRHESLRTIFQRVDERPVQVVVPEAGLELPLVELGSDAEAQQQLAALALAEARHAFDLASGPLIRARLVRCSAEDHVLLLNMHHIVSDGWSMGVVSDELKEIYRALCVGEEPHLEELPVQYADYAAWQNRWLKSGVLDEQLAYWKRQLDGIPTLLELPGDRPRPAEKSYRGACEEWVLSAELHESLVALGRREGVTVFMTLLAGLQILLHRYSGQEDIVVGSPIAGRQREELEKLIGFFVNTLVLRTDLSGNPTVSELLGRVRDVALGAYGHQDLPFEKLVEELNPPRSRSHSPLFQVMLVLQNAPQSTVEMPDLEVTEEGVHNGTSKFDLILSVTETEEGLKGSLEYSTDLFDATTIRRMLAHLQRLLEAMVADPAQHIGRLPMLSEDECRELLVEWNDTRRDYPCGQCVHQLFEEQVERAPEAVAAVFGDEELSYAELNTRANQLAHHLIELGVGPETLVALCVERSLEMLVGVLGILKAGGAYVPLYPSYPAERLAVMLEDTAAPVLLTQQRLADRLPQPDARVVWLDDEWPEIAAREQENPPCSAGPDDLAYVIYTSGSTGEPKGLAMPHRPLTALIAWQQHALPLAPAAAVAQFAPLSFDVSFQEMFTTWASGGRLVLMTDDERRDPFQLLGFLGRHGIQRLFLPFVALRQLAEAAAAQSEPLDALTEVITAGEQLHVTGEIAAFFARLPHCTLHNHYGPSETHVVTAFTLQGTPDQWSPLPSIGRPISNSRIYLLDGESQPVPVGVTGELHIGGHSLARGYFRRPELTEEKFVADPFGEAGARLYRTGDLARYLPDGNIEFVGRVDDQVKIRGFRIEPGEIEAVLGGHPGVAQSVVVAREDHPGDKRLVAYVMPVKAASVQVEELREALKKRVPEYMVPSAFVLLDALPLTPNGKLDRAALPAPEMHRPAELHVAPRTPTEELLTGIYEELLKHEKVGIHDDFFDLGGHSLIAARVISRVRATLGAELPIRSLFEAPTVAGLAAKIAQGGAPAAAEPLERVERSGALELSHAQRRLWFLDQYETNRTVYNIPLAVRLRGRLDAERLREALERIVRRHESLRTIFQSMDERPVQVVVPEAGLELPLVELGSDAEAQQQLAELALAEARQAFDLESGPLIRARLVRCSAEDHVLLLTLHHIVSDGWSLGVIFDELKEIYRALCVGEEPHLEELQVQYADYAAWQNRWLKGGVLDEQLTYWKRQLDGIPTLLELPTHRPRPAEQSYRGGCEEWQLSIELTEELRALSQREGVTLFMTLLAGLQVLLHRYSGQEDIVVGSPIAGRNRKEFEKLIGFFVNTLVLRTDLAGNPTVSELLGRVREVALGAYGHQDLPFEKLVEELNPPRSRSHSPLFQVMLVLQNAPQSTVKMPELEVVEEDVHNGTSKFDLTLSVAETEEGLKGSLEYSTDLFDAATIRRMLAHLQRLLEAMVADPAQRIGRLPMLSVGERKAVLDEFNRPSAQPLPTRSVVELFDEQAAAHPERIALRQDGRQLSFRELQLQANALAATLVATGVGFGAPVAIFMRRSIEVVIGIVAVLKARATYIPLDPGNPSPRTQYILADSGAVLVLVRDGAEAESLNTSIPILGVTATATTAGIPPPNPEPPALSDQAYMIYTSGSTGTPKGVPIAHGGLADYIEWAARQCVRGDQLSFPLFTSLSFDLTVTCLYLPLVTGGTLEIYEETEGPVDSAVMDVVRDNRVDFIKLTPSHLSLMRQMDLSTSRLKRMMVGGEDFKTDLAAAISSQFGDKIEIYNSYGPTEAVVNCMIHRYDPRTDHDTSVPIGRAADHVQLYVLNEALVPVPEGTPGELCISRYGLASGYHQREELSAKKFVPHPFIEGERLYRTGDLVRFTRPACLGYLGRIDHQVKIRGFRIELGEIESVLGHQPGVAQSVVVAREDHPGDKRLVAYVMPVSAANPQVKELRDALKEQLPEYMVPAAFVVLDALPLTPNGKLDRAALPAPESQFRQEEQVDAAPHTLLETKLVELWKHILGNEEIGCEDNFFELGGHSLSAMRLVWLLKQDLGYELPLSELFVHQTIRDLARRIESGTTGSAYRSLVPLRAGGERSPLYFVHGMGGDVFGFLPLARRLDTEQPVYGLQAIEQSGGEERFPSIEEAARHYISEILRFQPEGPYQLAGYSLGGMIAFEMARQLADRGIPVSFLGIIDTHPANLPRAIDRQMRFPYLLARLRHHAARVLNQHPAKSAAYVRGRLAALRHHLQPGRWLAQADSAPSSGEPAELDYYQRLHYLHTPTPAPVPVCLFYARENGMNIKAAWNYLASGGVRERCFPCDHLELLADSYADRLAEALQEELNG